MTILEFLGSRRKAEYPVFAKVLKAMPTGRFDYRPHERSPSAAEIVWTLARETKACCDIVDTGQFNWVAETPPADPEAILSAFQKHYAALDDRIDRMDRKRLAEKGAASDRRPALPGSAGRRVPLVYLFRRHSSSRPVEHLYSADGRPGSVDLRPVGRRPGFVNEATRRVIPAGSSGPCIGARGRRPAVGTGDSARRFSRCGSSLKKGQQGLPVSTLRSSQAIAFSVSPNTA